jgi:hypothetical protein
MSTHAFLFKRTINFRDGKFLLCKKDSLILQYYGIAKATEAARKYNGKVLRIPGCPNIFFIEQS